MGISTEMQLHVAATQSATAVNSPLVHVFPFHVLLPIIEKICTKSRRMIEEICKYVSQHYKDFQVGANIGQDIRVQSSTDTPAYEYE